MDEFTESENMLKAWKNFHRQNKHKKYKVEFESCANCKVDVSKAYVKDENGNYHCKDIIKGFYLKSDLSTIFHLLYAYIRKRDFRKFFSRESIRLITRNIGFDLYETRRKEYINKLQTVFGESLTEEYVLEFHKYLNNFCGENNTFLWNCYTGYKW